MSTAQSFDHHSAEQAADPVASYRKLRQRGGVEWSDGYGGFNHDAFHPRAECFHHPDLGLMYGYQRMPIRFTPGQAPLQWLGDDQRVSR